MILPTLEQRESERHTLFISFTTATFSAKHYADMGLPARYEKSRVFILPSRTFSRLKFFETTHEQLLNHSRDNAFQHKTEKNNQER